MSRAPAVSSPRFSRFGGPIGATPIAQRRYAVTMPVVADNMSTASASLMALTARLSGGSTLTVDIDVTGTPTLLGLDLDAGTPTTAYDARGRTTGAGDFELGVIGAAPGAVLINVFTTMVSTPTGSGPFLGLAADPILFMQAGSPLGTEPFNVLADGNGLYRFIVVAGILPAVQVDFLTAQFPPGGGAIILPAQTIAF